MSERTLASIIVANFLPDEISPSVMGYVDSHLDLLPGWVVELDVLWDDEFDAIAKMRPHVDYRRGKLTIGPSWVNASEKMRRRTIIHEFVHVQLGPLHILACRLLDIAGKNNDALDTELREQLRTALEQTTVDTTSLVERLLDHIERTPEAATPASPVLSASAHGSGRRLDAANGGGP